MSDDRTHTTRYEWTILQVGELPLRPDNRVDPGAEHRCTSVLIWPEGERPGHEPSLRALVFPSAAEEQVWIVGDAILDEAWLRAWGYYWPNQYRPPEIVRTWQSVAAILSGADVVVPGHGPPIPVTPELLENLIAGFPTADQPDRCPEVAQALRARLQTLRTP